MSSLVSSFAVSLAESATPASNCTSPASSASSTAVNTPVDEVLRSLGDVGVYDAALDDEGNDGDQVVTPKSLFHKGFRQVTQRFTHGLVLPKMRVKSMALSNTIESSELKLTPRVPKSPTVQSGVQKILRIQSLPNHGARPRLQRQVPFIPEYCLSPIPANGIIPGNNTPIPTEATDAFEGPRMHVDEPTAEEPVTAVTAKSSGMSRLISLAKVVSFLPWIIAAGCAFLLFPQNLEFLIFQTGYISANTKLQRFAVLAEISNVAVIFAFAVALVGFSYSVDVFSVLICVILARLMFAWKDFRFDQTIPLGEDDQQSVYRIFMVDHYGITNDTVVRNHWGSLVKMNSVEGGEDET